MHFFKTFLSLLVLSFFLGVIFLPYPLQAQEPTDPETADLIQQQNLDQLKALTDLFTMQFPDESARDVTSSMTDIQGIELHIRAAIDDFANRIPLFSGEGDGIQFGAETILLRAVVAEVLLRLARLGELPDYDTDISGIENTLLDVAAGVWFEEAMLVAIKNRVFIPQNSRVRPGDSVNWAEMVTILRRFLGMKPIVPELSPFYLVNEGEWYTQEFYTLERLSILPRFYEHPGDNPTKADFTHLLYYAVGQASIASPSLDLGESGTFSCSQGDRQVTCMTDYARYKKDVSLCTDIIGQNFRDDCIYEVGIASADYSICDQITCGNVSCSQIDVDTLEPDAYGEIMDPHGDWRDCYIEVSGVLQDYSLCEDLGMRCYTAVAVSLGDASICDEQEFSGDKSYCYSKVAKETKDPSLCAQLEEGTLQWECYDQVGIVMLRADLCDKSAAFLRDACLYWVGIDTGNPDVCEKIVDEDKKITCFNLVAEELADVSICERMTVNPDECFAAVARSLDDLSICERMTANPDECFAAVARSLDDLSICSRVNDESVRYDCEEYIQPTNCDQMSILCEFRINENYCDTFENEQLKHECVWVRAVDFLRDRRECEKVELSDLKQECYEYFDRFSQRIRICENTKEMQPREACFKHSRFY